ncbi:hypothetical protein [Nocardia takedensis]|uniref:hypothetical protein n=1 Tax=Nocardia takedensis TaxID=259390 RepID=UPI0002F9CAF6|nr:hypothetical protein [Nocardia takedensis]
MTREQHALGWVDPCSPTTEWDTAQVRRLARRLGYGVRWADPASPLDLVEQVEAAGVEVVLMSSSAHVTAWDLVRLLVSADVECAAPRESFPRHADVQRVRR